MSAFAPVLSQRKPAPGAAGFALAGLLPVSSIALHCAGIISIVNCLFFLVIPAFVLAFITSSINTRILKLAMLGWISGIVAVALYDLSRIPFILAGWTDFIPHISHWLSPGNDHPYLIGYTWRYAGNGGGLGIVFFLLADHFGWRKYIVSSGVTFGLIVFTCLVALLVIFPDAQNMMFRITPVSFFGGLTGHIVYGYVLGALHKKWSRGEK
jgi:hypothetical protein